MAIWLFIVPFTLAAALPGAAQGALIAQVLGRGGRDTVPFALGMVIGNAIWLMTAILGLSTLALRFVVGFLVVKWLGVAYLLFVAWKLWTSPVGTETATAPSERGLIAGIFLSLGNPKAVVFFGAVLPHAFDMTSLSMSGVVLILLLGVVIDLVVQLAYLAAASRARVFIGSPRRMQAANRTAAGLLVGSATLIATRH